MVVVYIFMFEFAPIIRGKGVISTAQANSGLVKILALIFPVLGAFSGYYFTQEGKKRLTRAISRERWLAAIGATVIYHITLFILLLIFIYLHDYRGSEDGIGQEESSFDEQIAFVMQLGVYFSAIATAPASFLVGGERINVRGAASTGRQEAADE
jgi:hypothetical protein